MKRIVLLAIAWVGLTVTSVTADVPRYIDYQGRLMDAAGKAVPNSDTNVVIINLYNSTQSSVLWTKAFVNVATRNGYFSLTLGDATTQWTALDFNQQYYLGIQIGGDAGEMLPRQLLNSVPYALKAAAVTENAITTSMIADGAVTASKLSGGDGVRPGTIILWNGNNCPAGYTRLSQFDGMFPRGATSYGGTGGADSHSHGAATGAGGAHGHSYSGATGANAMVSSGSAMAQTNGMAPIYHTHDYSGSTGTEPAHSHSISGDSNVPKYFNILFCLKN